MRQLRIITTERYKFLTKLFGLYLGLEALFVLFSLLTAYVETLNCEWQLDTWLNPNTNLNLNLRVFVANEHGSGTTQKLTRYSCFICAFRARVPLGNALWHQKEPLMSKIKMVSIRRGNA